MGMDPSEWIAAFRQLHGRVKQGGVEGKDLARYQAMREELARSLVAAQGMNVPDGQLARKHFRVAQVYQLEVNNLYKTVTRDISRAGFSALVPTAFKEGEQVSFSITLARGQEPISGQAKVVAVVRQQGNSRISFSIDYLNEASAELLEMALFDAVLARL